MAEEVYTRRFLNSINIKKEVGKAETNIWLGDTMFVISIEKAIGMLQQIESYALECYNVTLGHIHSINQLKTKKEIESYDFKQSYSGKLNFEG